MADMTKEEILALAEGWELFAPTAERKGAERAAREARICARALRLLAGEGEPGAIKGVDNQVMVAAAMMDAEQKKNPEWLWYTHDSSRFSFSRWSSDPASAPYVRADLVAPSARSYAEGVEDAAKWHESEIARLEQQIIENDEYAKRCPEAGSGGNTYCRAKITAHQFSIEAIRTLAPKEA